MSPRGEAASKLVSSSSHSLLHERIYPLGRCPSNTVLASPGRAHTCNVILPHLSLTHVLGSVGNARRVPWLLPSTKYFNYLSFISSISMPLTIISSWSSFLTGSQSSPAKNSCLHIQEQNHHFFPQLLITDFSPVNLCYIVFHHLESWFILCPFSPLQENITLKSRC